ncbi:alanine racemase [Haemophilus parahaemolyticus]|uniref:Alanine racemase n=2 Tax=Haemophilus parahaemolyticus TaxID=735 RepID=A0AAE6JSK6_HAEPH|nr:alanine racemase [Haemophilus parahaemolyticus]EIJ67489.1 alanine racemase [Haemophilus parahaemolyticus HK385]OOR95530.1 alanine racemase [Haemophilus parahaemolyticus]QEN11334.1 alanine racemase [Haemophilus parahaemolyticus]QRP12529.1 alanine racemase [Haemophilus parahaemolyticus]STO66676.1 alanine racemase [Haemophilus parahaemolyticus HK385]
MKPAIATINSAALRHNIQLIKSFAPNQKLLAMIKANAYGQGLLPAAHILADQVDGFGVARLREALEIQETGYTGKILLVEGFFDREELLKTLSRRFDSVIHCYEQLELLEQVAKEWEEEQQKGFWKRKTKIYFPINVWLKIDTGMHRLGVHPEQVDEFYQRLKKCPLVESISFVSHFSRADELDCGYTEKQISTFEQATQAYPEHARSISASSGILYWKQAHYEWVRPGIIMHGISPHYEPITHLGFQPVMTLSSSLIAVRTHKAGEPVGYGGTWVSSQDTKLGVIAMGYGDGYPRNAPEGTPVLINGRKVPIVGRVSMDMLTVDLGADSQDKVGDEAIFWGKDLLIEEIAEHIGVISYELITKLTPRVIFEYQ